LPILRLRPSASESKQVENRRGNCLQQSFPGVLENGAYSFQHGFEQLAERHFPGSKRLQNLQPNTRNPVLGKKSCGWTLAVFAEQHQSQQAVASQCAVPGFFSISRSSCLLAHR
jgi:hypothetical protein